MNVGSWLKQASASGVDRLDAELILATVIQKERIFLCSHPEYEISEQEKGEASQMLARRLAHEPLAYILGYKEFYGRKFRVTPHTLIPRPETEAIIRNIKSLFTSFPELNRSSPAILDVGTGSGCIAISLALELPNSQVTAVDISAKALDCAKYNAMQLGATNISIKKSNLFSAAPEKYDIVVANLPYVDRTWPWLDHATLGYEPAQALFANDEGLAEIKKLMLAVSAHLRQNGFVILEADKSQHQKISDFVAENTDLAPIAPDDSQSLVLIWQMSAPKH